MVKVAIDLKWPVASAYTLLHGAPARRETGTSLTSGDSQWGSLDRLKAAGKCKVQRPLDEETPLYAKFERLDGSPEGFLGFARQYGLLRNASTAEEAEPLFVWADLQKELRSFRKVVEAAKRKTAPRLTRILDAGGLSTGARIEAVITRRPQNGHLVLALRPANLENAIRLQMAQALASGHIIKTCDNCGMWFEAGPDARRRIEARFCTDRCRTAYNNNLKKVARETAGTTSAQSRGSHSSPQR